MRTVPVVDDDVAGMRQGILRSLRLWAGLCGFAGLPGFEPGAQLRPPHQIRVNAVCPGEIHPPMLEPGVKRSGRAIADLDRVAPYGRIGKPEDVAAPSRLPGE